MLLKMKSELLNLLKEKKMKLIDLVSPLENSAVVSIILVISHPSAVNNIFFVLLLRKPKSVYVNEFVFKKELKKEISLNSP